MRESACIFWDIFIIAASGVSRTRTQRNQKTTSTGFTDSFYPFLWGEAEENHEKDTGLSQSLCKPPNLFGAAPLPVHPYRLL